MLNLLAQSEVKTFTADQVLAPYVGVFVAAFLVSFAATPLMRKLAMVYGIVDWPDRKRKAHLEPVAYLGGVALFLGWFAGVTLCFFLTPHDPTLSSGVSASINFPISILVGATIICTVGLIDDVYGISPRVKVGGQLLAAALLAGQTVGTKLAVGLIRHVTNLLDVDPTIIPGFGAANPWYDPSYWLGALIVAFLVLGGCNALNLIDGLDGLSTGVTGIASLGFLFISVSLAMGAWSASGAYSPQWFDPVRIVMCLAVLGAVLGFLPYNFNPASIFMGDAGSLLLGYLSITSILLFAEKGHIDLVMAGLIVFALPILDTSLAIVRRKARGQPLFSPDNQHIHHQLIRSGMSVKGAVITLYGAAVCFAVIGSLLIFLRTRYVTVIFMVMFGFIAVVAHKIGHRQYLAAQANKPSSPAPAAEPPDMPSDTHSPDKSDAPAKP